MGLPQSTNRSERLGDCEIPDKRSKITKNKTGSKSRRTSQHGLKYKNGLLNTAIAARSDLMKIAKRNSNESPLLRLPSEIRSKIWEYAVGYHRIFIHEGAYDSRSSSTIRPIHVSIPLEAGTGTRARFVRPSFALPKVCRQLYVEAAAMVYTLNSFSFHTKSLMDRFIKYRALGQRRLITSVHVALKYFLLYAAGSRKSLRRTFPNIKRVIVPASATGYAPRMYPSTWALTNSHRQSFEDTRKVIEEFLKEKEGADLEVDWDE